MTQTYFKTTGSGVAAESSQNVPTSAFPEVLNALQGEGHPPLNAPTSSSGSELATLERTFKIHSALMLESATPTEIAGPICYIRVQKTENSSSSLSKVVDECYDRVERQLVSLSAWQGPGAPVEIGAIRSAIDIIHALKFYQIAPPEISWHGGDAVVMLWSLGETTYAITVTDGEFGYVVRRNRRALKMGDSIPTKSIVLKAFRLLGTD